MEPEEKVDAVERFTALYGYPRSTDEYDLAIIAAYNAICPRAELTLRRLTDEEVADANVEGM